MVFYKIIRRLRNNCHVVRRRSYYCIIGRRCSCGPRLAKVLMLPLLITALLVTGVYTNDVHRDPEEHMNAVSVFTEPFIKS